MFTFLKSVPGRILRFVAGFLLVVTGAYFNPATALVLIALGTMMAVETLAGECLLETIVNRRVKARHGAAPAPVTR